MPTISIQAHDGKTIDVNVAEGTDPSRYRSIAEEAKQKYASQAPGQGGASPLQTPEQPEANLSMVNAAEQEKQRRADGLQMMNQTFNGNGLMPGHLAAGHVLNALEGVARLSRTGTKGLEELGAMLGGPKLEKTLGIGARFLLPQDKMQSAMAIATALAPMDKIAEAVPGVLQRTRVVQPNMAQKALGTLISTTTAVPERHASAVIADSSILSKATPGTEEVSKEYTKVFDALGIKFDTKTVQKYLNRNFIPNEAEGQTLYKKLFAISEKFAADPLSVPPEEAFMGRSMASALERSKLSIDNTFMKTFASGIKSEMDSHLENSGVSQIKDLSAKWFRATAKESFDSLLPRNKNMSPSALRGLIALKLVADSVGHFAKGEHMQAIGKGIEAASMSPRTVGLGIQGASKAITPGTSYLAGKAATGLLGSQ